MPRKTKQFPQIHFKDLLLKSAEFNYEGVI